MDLQPPALSRLDDVGVLAQDGHAAANVGLDEAEALVRGAEGGPVLVGAGQVAAQGAQREQPGVEQAQAGVAQGGVGAAAQGVAAQHDVLDLQVHDGVGDDRRGGDVPRVQHVGDVPVHEHVAGFAAQEGGLGHARVRAADPEDGGGLAFGEGGEELRVGGWEGGRPGFVGVQVLGEGVGEGVFVVVAMALVVVVVREGGGGLVCRGGGLVCRGGGLLCRGGGWVCCRGVGCCGGIGVSEEGCDGCRRGIGT